MAKLRKRSMDISYLELNLLMLPHGTFWRRDMEIHSQLQNHIEISSKRGIRWALETVLSSDNLLIFFVVVRLPWFTSRH